MKQSFSTRLLNWFGKGKRDMPWKKTKNPYHIWISEIILQQTRVAQGHDYYLKFIKTFPSVNVLANASEDEVLQCWKGLGYYSRARNIHFAAKQIMEIHSGVFPDDYKSILALKGIGPYSAAAIASFAFDLPYAVADGNVYRVLSRYTGTKESIDQPKTKKALAALATEWLDQNRAADFNQAIMDLGAMVCTPKKVRCGECPFQKDCKAYQHDLVSELPVRTPKKAKKQRFFHYLIISKNDEILMNQRGPSDVWQGLYDFPLIEMTSESEMQSKDWVKHLDHLELKITQDFKIGGIKSNTQLLSHQKIHATFYPIHVKSISFAVEKYRFISKSEQDKIAVPKLIDWYLNDKTITLF